MLESVLLILQAMSPTHLAIVCTFLLLLAAMILIAEPSIVRRLMKRKRSRSSGDDRTGKPPT